MAAEDKLSPGDTFGPPRAEMWNAMVGAGEQYQASRLGVSAPPPAPPRSTDIIKVKNVSGAARSRGEVLGDFGLSLTNLSAENLQLTGNAPVEGGHAGVLLKALPSGAIGEIQLGGVCLATVDISDTAHKFAEIDPGVHVLKSADSGPFDLIYAPASTGEQECVVRFGGSGAGFRVYLYTLTSGWSSGTATADITELDGTSVETGATINDEDGTFATLGSGDSGKCFKQDGSYSTLQAPCP